MNFQRMGYIGKSFTMGALGILGTLVACGGGGVTNTVAASVASPYVLFASAYKEHPDAGGELKAQTFEGGKVYANSDGAGFKWGQYSDGTWTNDAMKERQSFGIKWLQDTTTPTASSYTYQAILAPQNSSVNINQSTKLVIQMGNGSWNQYDPNSKKVFRIKLEGGTHDGSSFPQSCFYDKTLDPAAIKDSNLAGANYYGLRTYEIDLSSFTCTQGNLTTLKNELKQVTVLLVGGIDSATDNTSGAYTYVQTGMIAFSN